MAEDYTAMPREEAVRAIMRDRGVNEIRARFILSILLGEREGDIEIEES